MALINKKQVNHYKKGKIGEEIVVTLLEDQEYRILAKNYKTAIGEVDIIATKNDVVAFIEVKFRFSDLVPLEALISYKKQRRIIISAKQFIALHNLQNKIFRFDVALVKKTGQTMYCNYIESAFLSDE